MTPTPGPKRPAQKKSKPESIKKAVENPSHISTSSTYFDDTEIGLGAQPDPSTITGIKKTPWWSTVLQVIFLAAIVFGCIWFYQNRKGLIFSDYATWVPALTPGTILFLSISTAFTWVRIWKFGTVKPFTCIKCMSGWLSLLFAWLFHAPEPLIYLPMGLFIGAMFEAIQMRWL